MNSALIALVVFLIVLGGGLAGLYIRKLVPPSHWNPETKDVVTLGMGLIGTMSALLLGMQLSSAKDSYDAVDGEMKQIVAKMSYLDRVLALYGDEGRPARDTIKNAANRALTQLWSKNNEHASIPAPYASGGEMLMPQLQQLSGDTPAKEALRDEAIRLAMEIGQLRWLMFTDGHLGVSVVFMIVVVVWLTVVFAGFGVLGTPNITVIATLILSALSVAAAIGLILELNRPFSGLLEISDQPLRRAIEMLGK